MQVTVTDAVEEALHLLRETLVRIPAVLGVTAASAHGFRRAHLGVYQTLLSKLDAGVAGLPLIRNDWYSQ